MGNFNGTRRSRSKVATLTAGFLAAYTPFLGITSPAYAATSLQPTPKIKADSDICKRLRDRMDSIGHGGIIGNNGGLVAGYLVLFIEYKARGCSLDALGTPNADVRAGEPFQIPSPTQNGASWMMRLNSYGHLESWSRYYGHKHGLSDEYQFVDVSPVGGAYDFSARIKVGNGPYKGKCLNFDDYEVVAGGCNSWSGKWRIIALDGKKDATQFKIGIYFGGKWSYVGFHEPKTSEAGYGGYADVYTNNSRPWTFVKSRGG
ncbi:hypothetical protein [Streptomyces sp. A1-5]|uniref:hypothetical protein n=1 Tax=Streptomyces sp. A1-5 TaxID=2738410 RepID=UPI001F2BA770|nr:hypothetical protein [Streptomyces sp. A1-5]UJB41912.1 hypothetical protein HRD51_14670 [Streptomyces sp. A1-5]